ncbi:DUF1127 domain-containing protein [Rhodoligotrophos defluvii]|uniref:DUF1127 domain-containing protein n=1 Tax=Rhodoligotrophos defluvii TaxID=2561934 RepID=UPI0010C95ED2|nr:DUF1127 domain-containing protein [Rhodoligotrophos defluvii]
MSVISFEKDRSVNGRSVRAGGAEQASSGFAGRILARAKRYLELSRAERELDQLDDRLLADIGLNRGDIRRMVWGTEAQR